ncbi:RagB/SusD family nutrient uptake outer membrane protein [uncultured Parabacteroides sp.]|uniref:RagB/SusD family nutrient uptake outer membrane protein n=1 Tax=uncultured Parabacteroides sp. TaxID=512312 RepID=UPI00258424B8|nr:RagB/SusD family nutrient uptake outer membrane protein [uncultured Parabacteroides sp.]
MDTKIVKYGILSLFCFAVAACSDFLDTQQRGVTSLESFYNTDEEVQEGLYAIYDAVQGPTWTGRTTFQFTNLLSDDAHAADGPRGNPDGEVIAEFRFDSNSNMIREMFDKYYRIAYKANVLISCIEPEDELRKTAIAEAKALRAYAYFELVTLWGPVPLVTHPLNPSEYAQPNTPVDEIWAQIEKDLTEAIADLPLKSQQSLARKGNVSKGTAQAWLGKSYLYQKKYDQAAAELDKVIASGEYGLHPVFSEVTRRVTEFGTESLFEISYNDNISNMGEATPVLAFCGPLSPWFKAGTSGISEKAWGAYQARQCLYDVFVKAGDVVRRKGTVINEEELINDFGGSYRDADGHLPGGSDGLIRIKYGSFVDETPGEHAHAVGGTNFRIMRYADVLLMAAEAYNRKSSPDDARALSYINQVRARAEMLPLTETGDQLFEAIKLERRLELAFEFVRFQDLIRWGDAEKYLKDKGKRIPRGDGTYIEQSDAGFKERHWLLPFPEAEISVNPNIVQNPGW